MMPWCFGHPPPAMPAYVVDALEAPTRMAEQHLAVRFGDHVTTLNGRLPQVGELPWEEPDPYAFECWLGDDGWIARYRCDDQGRRYVCEACGSPTVAAEWIPGTVVLR